MSATPVTENKQVGDIDRRDVSPINDKSTEESNSTRRGGDGSQIT